MLLFFTCFRIKIKNTKIFFQVGTNRAEASLERVQQLNPMVEVTADSGNIKEKDGDFFKEFDIVIATTCE